MTQTLLGRAHILLSKHNSDACERVLQMQLELGAFILASGAAILLTTTSLQSFY
jgi:hypothetical protein